METQGTYNLDSVPVSGLTDRYQIGRTALYDRLKALGIEPEKRGRSSHISGAQLREMDQLDTRLKNGEPMPSTTSNLAAEPDRRTFTEHSPDRSESLSPSTDLGLILAKLYPPDRLSNYRDLQAAADHGWLLPSDKVRELVGVKPHGEEFDRMGFRFVRSARRNEWKVTNLD